MKKTIEKINEKIEKIDLSATCFLITLIILGVVITCSGVYYIVTHIIYKAVLILCGMLGL